MTDMMERAQVTADVYDEQGICGADIFGCRPFGYTMSDHCIFDIKMEKAYGYREKGSS